MSALSRIIFGGAAAVTLLAAATPVYANDEQTASYRANRASNVAEAGVLSRNFAKEHDAIGVAIGFKKYEGAPNPEEIGERFKQEFGKLGEKAEYFIYPTLNPGYVVSFDHAKSGSGFMKLTKAAQSIRSFVDEKRRFEELLDSVTGSRIADPN